MKEGNLPRINQLFNTTVGGWIPDSQDIEVLELSNFYIKDNSSTDTYERSFESDMTFGEFVNSKYNIEPKLSIWGETIKLGSKNCIIYITKDTKIESNETYTFGDVD